MNRSLSFEIVRRFPAGATVEVSLEVPLDDAPVTVLFGPSGSGKTTVLRCLAGLDRPEAGAIRFEDEVWFDAASGTWRSPQRRRVGLLFQDYALFPHLTVAGNLSYGIAGLGGRERAERVSEVARLFRIEGLLTRHPARLSGGERQRVALARALACRPRLLLLDEPLSALDGPAREELRGELRELLLASRTPALVVTHDRTEALTLGDRLAVIVGGSVRQIGPVEEVLGAPVDSSVAKAVGMENVCSGKIVEREEGLMVVESGSVRFVAIDPGLPGEHVYVCVRAEDIVLELAGNAATSARNRLPARVMSLAAEGPLVRVGLDCGIRLQALVTRRSAGELGLVVGKEVAALVKASAMRVVSRGT